MEIPRRIIFWLGNIAKMSLTYDFLHTFGVNVTSTLLTSSIQMRVCRSSDERKRKTSLRCELKHEFVSQLVVTYSVRSPFKSFDAMQFSQESHEYLFHFQQIATKCFQNDQQFHHYFSLLVNSPTFTIFLLPMVRQIMTSIHMSTNSRAAENKEIGKANNENAKTIEIILDSTFTHPRDSPAGLRMCTFRRQYNNSYAK